MRDEEKQMTVLSANTKPFPFSLKMDCTYLVDVYLCGRMVWFLRILFGIGKSLNNVVYPIIWFLRYLTNNMLRSLRGVHLGLSSAGSMQSLPFDSAEWSANRDWRLNREGPCAVKRPFEGFPQLSSKILGKYQKFELSQGTVFSYLKV